MSVENIAQERKIDKTIIRIPEPTFIRGLVRLPQTRYHDSESPIELSGGISSRMRLVDNSFDTQPELPELTPLELNALYCLAKGDKVLDIRRKYNTTRSFSLKTIYDKYNVTNETQAVSMAIKHNILDVENLAREFDFSRIEELNDKQLHILRGLTVTKLPNTNEEIAKELSISVPSVSGYLSSMYATYELGTRPKAAAFYLIAEKKGLISLPEKKSVLTEMESIVLSYAARGLSLQETADTLDRSFHTVDTHKDRIFKKYQSNNQTQSVVVALKKGDLPAQDLLQHFDFSNVNDLTERQKKILNELINIDQENSNKDIAERTGLSPMTITRDLKNIRTQHNLRSRAHIAAYYLLAERAGVLVEKNLVPAEMEKKLRLTKAEKIALTHAAKGLSSKESGKLLRIKACSVDGRIEAAAKKYLVSRKTQAVVAAVREGDILLEDIADAYDISAASRLTPKQTLVLRELVNIEESSSDEAIGKRLAMNKLNVKYYMRQILSTFEFKNRTQAAVFYLLAERKGLLQHESHVVDQEVSVATKMHVIYEATKKHTTDTHA